MYDWISQWTNYTGCTCDYVYELMDFVRMDYGSYGFYHYGFWFMDFCTMDFGIMAFVAVPVDRLAAYIALSWWIS